MEHLNLRSSLMQHKGYSKFSVVYLILAFFTITAHATAHYDTITASVAMGIGTVAPNSNAALDMVSTTKGFYMPRLTTSQKNLIIGPSSGLMVYDTTLVTPSFFDGSTWKSLTTTAPTNGLLFPVMSTVTRNSIAGPAQGAHIFNSDTNVDNFYTGAAWLGQHAFQSTVTFTTVGVNSWTIPQDVSAIHIVFCGGGGGGSGGHDNPSAGGGGGGGSSGAHRNLFVQVTAASTASITVGSGGTQGAADSDGSDGTASQVVVNGHTYTVLGGKAGSGSSGTTGGHGACFNNSFQATWTSPTMTCSGDGGNSGGNGKPGQASDSTAGGALGTGCSSFGGGGGGGSSLFGAGGAGGSCGNAGGTPSGTSYCAGGGGGGSGNGGVGIHGGDGAQGYVEIRF